jgi:hypothetical protein
MSLWPFLSLEKEKPYPKTRADGVHSVYYNAIYNTCRNVRTLIPLTRPREYKAISNGQMHRVSENFED